MNATRFWAFIDDTRRVSDADPSQHAAVLRCRLESLPPAEIVAFEAWWRRCDALAYRWDLLAAAYLLNGGCDAACFEHFRSYVIGLGRPVFLAALDEPDSLVFLARGQSHQFAHDAAELGYAAMDAYLAATGAEMPDVGPELPNELAGEEWDVETPEIVVPRIAAAVGWLEA